MTHPLAGILAEAARGRPPPADGTVVVTGPPPGRASAVVAFTAHHVIAAAVGDGAARARLPEGDLGAPMGAEFLMWLGGRIGATPGTLDVVLAATGTGDGAALPPIDAAPHPRVGRAVRYRDDVAVFGSDDGIVVLGRGLAGRREVAVDGAPEHRGRGAGRRLAAAARALTPAGEPLFAQVAPGNAASVRAFLAAGYRPIGAEVLFLP